jgi:hypothetical protein
VPATVDAGSIQQVAGDGSGTVDVRVLNSALVPDGHTFRIDFLGEPDSVRALRYSLTDVTTGERLLDFGRDFEGAGTGPSGAGLQPVISTPTVARVDSSASGFTPESSTGVDLEGRYVVAGGLPNNLVRPGYPEEIIITFADTPLDTSIAAIGLPAIPAHFRINGAESGVQLNFRFRDLNGNRTLDQEGEFVIVLTAAPATPTSLRATWQIEVTGASSDAPGAGDVFRLPLIQPYGPGDAFEFTVSGEYIDPDSARSAFQAEEPYVVPNPYVASAAFEPERFAVSGRGDRRLEFRAIPAGATIRIYDIRGRLVQTLTHDGSTTGMVAWDLRTRENLDIAAGLYLFHVDAGELGDFVGRFAIIK